MKILIAASTMSHINSFHLPYIKKLEEAGHDVYTLTGTESSSCTVKLKKRTLSISNLSACFEIRKYLKQMDFDIVFLHTSLAAFWVRMAMKGLGKRPYVVNTVHGYLFGEGFGWLHNKIYLACERALKKQTDDIIVMNGEDCEIATRNKLCTGEVIFSYGMGVPFKRGEIQPIKSNDGKKSLVFVGEISKRKNQIFLINAMQELPNCTLTLVGGGDGMAKINNYIKKAGLEDRVSVTGFTDKAYEYIKGCDVYVSASHVEGLPFNIMEAMYLKKPIVASRVKGHTDLLPPQNLFTQGNMAEFVSMVNEMLHKTEEDYSTEKYSLDTVLPKNMEVYTSIIEKIQPKVAKEQPTVC